MNKDKEARKNKLESLEKVGGDALVGTFLAPVPEALLYTHVLDHYISNGRAAGQIIMRVINITSDPALITIRLEDLREIYGSVPLEQAKLCATSQDIIQIDQMFYTTKARRMHIGFDGPDEFSAHLDLLELQPVSTVAPEYNGANEMRAAPVPTENLPLYVARGDRFDISGEGETVVKRTFFFESVGSVTVEVETDRGRVYSKNVPTAQAVSAVAPTDYYKYQQSYLLSVYGKSVVGDPFEILTRFKAASLTLIPHSK